MIPYLGIAFAGLAFGASAFCLFLTHRHRKSARVEAKQLRGEVFAHAMEEASRVDVLKLQLETLEACTRNTGEILREGRLNHSTRARAFELLRSGVSSETAASKLGVAKREMKLLARVSQVLAAYR